MTPREVRRHDFPTCLSTLAARLRVYGHALRGMAVLDGDAASAEHRTRIELADDLAIIAECLEGLRSSVCPRCQAIEVVESLAIDPPQRTAK